MYSLEALLQKRTELMEMKIHGGEILKEKVEELWSINFSYLFLQALINAGGFP
jgi:hypothetical protein